jgi:hypothetical protein
MRTLGPVLLINGSGSGSGFDLFASNLQFGNKIMLITFLKVLGLRIHIHLIRIQHFRLNTDPDLDPGP